MANLISKIIVSFVVFSIVGLILNKLKTSSLLLLHAAVFKKKSSCCIFINSTFSFLFINRNSPNAMYNLSV